MHKSSVTQHIGSKYRWILHESNAFCANTAPEFLKQRLQQIQHPWIPIDEDYPLKVLPSPDTLKDMDKAVNRTVQAITSQENITIFADYDVDGITAAAMLRTFFRSIGTTVSVYIPDRLTEGYGLNKIGIDKLKELKTALIITVDNGISAIEACEHAKALGIDVIITDHHDCPHEVPNAVAVINPKQADCLYPFKELAGVGVAFQYLIALRKILRDTNIVKNVPNLRSFLDFVALGTIADLAPIKGINHILCKVGLAVLQENMQSQKRLGLFALHNLVNKNNTEKTLKAEDIAFQIAPRLNAAGRIGSALISEELLQTESYDRAIELAQSLDCENRDRQQIERKATEEAFAELGFLSQIPNAIIIGSHDWHPGIIGLIASRLLEKYYKPVLVYGESNGKLRFSGRSTHSVDMFSILNKVKDKFIAFGGHFHAVGLTLEKSNCDWLRQYFIAEVTAATTAIDFIKPLEIDAAVDLETLNLPLLQSLDCLEPFGIHNPRPKWLVQSVQLCSIKRIGKDASQNHARALLKDQTKEIWVSAFSLAHKLEELLQHKQSIHLDVVLEARTQMWKGECKPEVRLIDFRSQE